jgi:hypothetical protein
MKIPDSYIPTNKPNPVNLIQFINAEILHQLTTNYVNLELGIRNQNINA